MAAEEGPPRLRDRLVWPRYAAIQVPSKLDVADRYRSSARFLSPLFMIGTRLGMTSALVFLSILDFFEEWGGLGA